MMQPCISNIPQLLAARVSAYGAKTFLASADDDRSWTYERFAAAVSGLSSILSERGVSKGDIVSLLLPNSPEYVIAYFACWHIGAVAGPINTLLRSEEIDWIISNSLPKLIIAADEFTEKLSGDVSVMRLDNISDIAPSDNASTIEIGIDDNAIIIYTSGTTGKPKGCILTHGNLLANARQIVDWMKFGENDRLLTVMPLFHMNAVSVTTMSALFAGGTTIVSRRFSATRFWDIVRRFQITSFGSVATMLSMLLASANDAKPDTSSIRFAMCGSAPVPVDVLERFEQTFDCLVIEGYGLSESTCRSTFNPPSTDRRPGSCGKPIGNEMRIVDDDDNELPCKELGEIVLRGDNIFKEYFRNAEATERAFRGGWFHTGDIGYRDPDGFYFIADRKSDMIIRGGENIYPREIDELLYSHPSVEAAAAFGIPDDLYGEAVAAAIVLKPTAALSEADVIAFCREHLADYKCPVKVHFLDELPKGPTGKILKRGLARLFSDAVGDALR